MPQTQTFLCTDASLLTLQSSTHEVDAGTQGCSGSFKPGHWLKENGDERSSPFFYLSLTCPTSATVQIQYDLVEGGHTLSGVNMATMAVEDYPLKPHDGHKPRYHEKKLLD